MFYRSSSSLLPLKRRKFTNCSMEAEAAKAKLAAAREKLGREIRVFETSLSSAPSQDSRSEESDDFYEFTAEDYYRIMATKKEDKFLKTRKLREAEEAARKSKISKSVIRIRFPDNYTLEATFHPSEKIQSLVDLLRKVIVQPELPFYLYTTPPKKQIKDISQDFYSAGFIPGAIVYFAYDIPVGDDATATNSGPILQEEILSLKGLELIAEQATTVQSEPEPEPQPVIPASNPVMEERKPSEKKTVKPKWLKM